ncbi:MAG: translation initiation factor IF-2 [Actinomycetota bacterium]
MAKVRVHEAAKKLGITSKEMLEKLKAAGIEAKTASSSIDEAALERLSAPAATLAEAPKAAPKQAPKPEQAPKPAPAPKTEAPKPEPKPEPVEAEPVAAPPGGAVHVQRGITVKDFGTKVGRAPAEIIKSLMSHGSMKSITQSLTDEELLVVADDLGIDVEIVDPMQEERLEGAEEAEATSVDGGAPRPPVVTVMGHVDHGKTTVLDRIRSSDVAAAEHGGITQHIGAYQVTKDGQRITFIDTPGHEAFTSMRARGAQVTDLAILVVAADDGVMPQTLEAIDHVRAANVPVVVAVNKMDKPEADPTRVRAELSEHGLQPQEWGGDTLFIDMSALSGEGLDDLLTGVVLLSDDLKLTAAPSGPARGVVLEAHLDKGRGPVATVLVQNGVLKIGDALVAGASWGKVRAMVDEWGDQIEEADPARPVLVLGWNGVPEGGDEVRVVGDERRARTVAQERDAARRHAENVTSRPMLTLDQLLAQSEQLDLIIKADVRGSLEAVTSELGKLDVGGIKVNVIRSAVGAIVESDVVLAKASGAVVVGFNVRPDAKSRELAERDGVDIRTYRIIYELIEEIERALKGMLAPVFRERVLGQAEVRETFKIPRAVVAGCYVTSGEIRRNASARLLRDGVVVFEGKIASLRHHDDDVREMAQGFECGIALENFNDIKIGDVIEAFETVEVAATV